jgi:hypothetical protein
MTTNHQDHQDHTLPRGLQVQAIRSILEEATRLGQSPVGFRRDSTFGLDFTDQDLAYWVEEGYLTHEERGGIDWYRILPEKVS